MFNPHWLRSFTTLAELGSFTRTADQLGITQAAVSQHLHHLEKQLGPLVVRKTRQASLTPAGKALLEYCRAMEQADRRLTQRLTEENTESGEVSLVTPGSIGLLIFPLLLALKDHKPGLVVRHRFAPDPEVIEAVLHNRFEVGLTTLRPDDERLTASEFAREPLELVLPQGCVGHQWADLHQLGFIDHPDGRSMATRLLSRRFPGNPGIRHLPCAGYTNQVALILEFVARGQGFTVLPRYARQAFARQQDIQVVACGQDVVDTLWLIHRAEWPMSGRARYTVDYLKQALASSEAEPGLSPGG